MSGDSKVLGLLLLFIWKSCAYVLVDFAHWCGYVFAYQFADLDLCLCILVSVLMLTWGFPWCTRSTAGSLVALVDYCILNRATGTTPRRNAYGPEPTWWLHLMMATVRKLQQRRKRLSQDHIAAVCMC